MLHAVFCRSRRAAEPRHRGLRDRGRTNHGNFFRRLNSLGMKYVLLGNNLITAEPKPPVNQVRFDDYGGTREATRYLIQLGHKNSISLETRLCPGASTATQRS